MDKEEWLKAINCSKEQLIEWLNEMYEDDRRLKQIIRTYEKNYAKVETISISNSDPLKDTEIIYEVTIADGSKYKKNWL